MATKVLRLFSGLIGLLCLCGSGSASAATTTVTIDEDGHGTLGVGTLTGSLAADTGPGGLTPVLAYSLPFTTVAGDVKLTDAGIFLDVVRFNAVPGTIPLTQVVFYSDNVDGVDNLGDTPSPPGAFYPNLTSIVEGSAYTPTANQPGFVSTDLTVTYVFNSDVERVPEPSTVTLLGIGGLGLIRCAYQRRKTRRSR